MAYDSRYDDPKYINAFLANMKADDKDPDHRSIDAINESDNEDNVTEPFPLLDVTSDTEIVSAAARPALAIASKMSPTARPFYPSQETGVRSLPRLTEEAKQVESWIKVQSMAANTDLALATESPADDSSQIALSADIDLLHDETAAATSSSSGSESSVDIIVGSPKIPELLIRSPKSETASVAPDETPKVLDCFLQQVNNPAGMIRGSKQVKEESREDATFFSTWGVPTSRKTEQARVRQIVLSNLPLTADYTLAQALIHGGAIETMSMSQSSAATMTAYMTFTDADACDAYHDRYPNGVEFKHQGKKHTAFVNKGQNVDVVSSVLQSYLDCGASRVVKITGADADWSMRALDKIASGNSGHRKVEAILDRYQNQNRTITFRFVKIADAVSFRGQLLRDRDWADTGVQFASDPCEKATAVHLE